MRLYSRSAPDLREMSKGLGDLPGDLKGKVFPSERELKGKPIVRGSVMDKSMREKKMGISAHFGTELAHRMRENELKPAKVSQSDELRHVVHMFSDCDDMDLREQISKLTDDDLWHFLQHLDLSDTPVDDRLMEIIAVRFFSLQTLKLQNCLEVGNKTCMHVAANALETLTSLDLSGCIQVDSDGVGWLAGSVGYGKSGCKQLQSLNLQGCCNVGDGGLVGLGSGGCPHLQFLNLCDCPNVTDVGVQGLAVGCKHVRVLNLARCIRVADGSLRAMAENCHMLKSVNLSRCAEVSDRGLLALGRGCKLMQSLNLSGCNKIGNAGIAAIARECSGLQLMNLSGLEKVGLDSLEQLLNGLPYAEVATSFFGFKPRANAIELKYKAQQRVINDAAAMRLQAAYRGFVIRGQWAEMLEYQAMNAASRDIATSWRRFCYHQRHCAVALHKCMGACARTIQCCARAHLARILMENLRRPIREALQQAAAITVLQAIIRGARARGRHPEIPRVIEALRRERWVEVQHCAASVLQTCWALYKTSRMMEAVREEYGQRRRDCSLAATCMQRMIRGYQARVYVCRLWLERLRVNAYRVWAATKLQCAWRGHFVREEMEHLREEMERLRLLREASALYIQSFVRMWLHGLKEWRLRKGEWDHCVQEAIRIQTVVRSKLLVPDWRALRYRRICGMIREQSRLDMLEVRHKVLEDEFRRLDELARDSASEDSLDSGDEPPEWQPEGFESDESWQELYDEEQGRKIWFNAKRQERRYDPPPTDDFEKEMVGTQVQIFWEMEETWFPGIVTKWNNRKKRHRIDYEDGDHEWMSLEQEHARVQVLERFPDGDVWCMMENYEPPKLKARRHKEHEHHLQVEAEKKEQEQRDQRKREEAKQAELDTLLDAAAKKRDKAWDREWSQAKGMWVEVNSVTGDERPYVDEATRAWQQQQQLAMAWTEGVDAATGRTYYYNPLSGATSWERPPEMVALLPPQPSAGDDWHEASDEATGRTYYYNQTTGESQFERPASMGMGQAEPEPVDALVAQGVGGGGYGLGGGAVGSAEDWQAAVDGKTGRTYYLNSKTGQRQFERPGQLSGFGTAEAEAGAEAGAGDTSAVVAASGEWQSAVDEESGRAYYYNATTGESTFDPPEQLATGEGWQGEYDGGYGEYGYEGGDEQYAEEEEEE